MWLKVHSGGVDDGIRSACSSVQGQENVSNRGALEPFNTKHRRVDRRVIKLVSLSHNLPWQYSIHPVQPPHDLDL